MPAAGLTAVQKGLKNGLFPVYIGVKVRIGVVLIGMKRAYDKTETNYMDDIRSIMENHANDVIKENKKKNSDRETALPSVRGVADFAKLFANDRISGAEKEKD